jgi:hypothetical protein
VLYFDHEWMNQHLTICPCTVTAYICCHLVVKNINNDIKSNDRTLWYATERGDNLLMPVAWNMFMFSLIRQSSSSQIKIIVVELGFDNQFDQKRRSVLRLTGSFPFFFAPFLENDVRFMKRRSVSMFLHTPNSVLPFLYFFKIVLHFYYVTSVNISYDFDSSLLN